VHHFQHSFNTGERASASSSWSVSSKGKTRKSSNIRSCLRMQTTLIVLVLLLQVAPAQPCDRLNYGLFFDCFCHPTADTRCDPDCTGVSIDILLFLATCGICLAFAACPISTACADPDEANVDSMCVCAHGIQYCGSSDWCLSARVQRGNLTRRQI
jgi:hypothetical protein